MALVSTVRMLRKAQREQYAVGHFNTSNLEFTQAIIRAAEEARSPVIVATSTSAISYAGYEQIASMVRLEAKRAKVPVALHLDHSPDFLHIRQCVKHGWTSVMRDASHLPFAQNVQATKQAVTFCSRHRVPVEAELGQLKGEEGWVRADEHVFTQPSSAAEFVRRTGCASLAVSIGTSHGAYKFLDTPKLDLHRLDAIASVVSVPLVLHGASAVHQDVLRSAIELGAKIEGASGVPNRQLRAAIRHGICKVNTDTDLRLEFTQSVREFLVQHPEVFDPRKILSDVREELRRSVMRRMDILGSTGKA